MATEIPDAYLVVFFAAGLPAVLALMAWIVRELYRTSSVTDRLLERDAQRREELEDHEGRLRRLEGAR